MFAMQTPGRALVPNSPIDSVAMAYRQSTFVFTGQVRRVNATTTPSVLAKDAIVVAVRSGVDTTYVSPKGMRPLAGRTVTVLVSPSRRWVVGETALFFAFGVAVDEGIALREVSHLPADSQPRSSITQVIMKARTFLSDDSLRVMFERSAAVVVGTVDTVTRVAAPTPTAGARREPRSAAWRDASVRIQTILKAGSVKPGPLIHVLFRTGQNSPGLTAPLIGGQQYLLGLRAPDSLGTPGVTGIARANRYVVIDDMDVRPVADTARVRQRR
jgi:hypothetical protein